MVVLNEQRCSGFELALTGMNDFRRIRKGRDKPASKDCSGVMQRCSQDVCIACWNSWVCEWERHEGGDDQGKKCEYEARFLIPSLVNLRPNHGANQSGNDSATDDGRNGEHRGWYRYAAGVEGGCVVANQHHESQN